MLLMLCMKRKGILFIFFAFFEAIEIHEICVIMQSKKGGKESEKETLGGVGKFIGLKAGCPQKCLHFTDSVLISAHIF